MEMKVHRKSVIKLAKNQRVPTKKKKKKKNSKNKKKK